MERHEKSFLHRADPVKRQQSVSKLANRSHSIAAVLKAVEAGKGHVVSADAYLPSPYRGVGGGGGGNSPTKPAPTQDQLFRASSFVQKTSYYDEELAAAEKQREMDRNVVLFPKELRGDNRFFNSVELGHKAAVLVQDSRRPSSLFSNGISSSCREELNLFQRVKKYEHIKSHNVAPMKRGGGSPARHGGGGGAFRPVDDSAFGHHVDDDADDPFPGMPSLLFRGHEERSRSRPGGGAAAGTFNSNEPQFLVHVEEQQREDIPERDKFGRRVEYGRMVGMFREEILASRPKRHDHVVHHAEVEDRTGVHKNTETTLDWSHMDLIDPVVLMDVLPRGGIVLFQDANGRETKKVLSAAPAATTTPLDVEKRRGSAKRRTTSATSSGGGGARSGSANRPRSSGAESGTTTSSNSQAVRRAATPGDGRAGTKSHPTQKQSATPLSKHDKPHDKPPSGKTAKHQGRGGKGTDSPPGGRSTTSIPGAGGSTGQHRASVHNNTSTTAAPTAHHTNAAGKGGGGGSKGDKGGNHQQQSASVTINELMPWERHKSPIWQLKYCFCDEDAEEIIQVQRKFVVVESGGQKYAFDPTKKHVSRDLEAEHEAQMSPAKRERLRWLRMNPAEREAHRIHMLLSCGKAYQGRLVNLSNNLFRSVDVMLTNTLAVLLRQNVTRLDLSFNKIETLDWNFLHVNIQEVEERKKRTMADAEAHEEEQMRHATLSHGGLLSDAQTQKQRDAFLVLRRRAVQDLVEVTAPHKLFYHLQSLYLHGNPLRDISELWKLEPLRLSLTYLTFHGSHHVDVQAKDPKNRAKLLATFPKLVQVNFTTLGDEEM